MLIAFIGIDGAGKTTMAKAIVEELRSINKPAAYLAPFRYVIFQALLTFVKKIIKKKKTDKNPLLERTKKPFFCKAWPLFALFDNWCFYLFIILPLLLRKKWVVCDRFFYDFAISFQYYGYTSEFINKIYLKFSPKADIVFVLDAPEKLAMERANELHINYYIEQRKRYLKLTKDYGFFVMNAALPINSLKENIMNQILEKNDKV